jgi:hypothetical protein
MNQTIKKRSLQYRMALVIATFGWLYGLGVIIYRDLSVYDKFAMATLVVGSALVWYMDQNND